MPGGIKVGDGYVEVRIKSDLDQDVKAAESKATPQAEKSGDSLGKTMAKGIGGAFAGLKLGEMITGAVDQSAVTANLQAKLSGSSKVVAAQAGKAAGKVFAEGYGENLEEVNDSISAINDNLGGLAKYSQKQTQSMSKDALTIANVYGEDVNSVIKTAGGLMKNGLAKNADEAFDIISSGMQNGLNNSDELLDSLNEYAEPLSAIGLDGPAALGAFKRSLDAGNFSIDKAGDAINEFATRSIDGSKTSEAAYKALGLNAGDMMERISKGGKSAKDATHEVISRLADMKDGVAQDAAGVGLFGSMWEDAGKKTIFALDPAKGAIDNVKGATDKMADANTSAANRVETMKRGIDQWKNSLIQTDGPVGDITAGLGVMGPEGIAAGAGVITASKGLGDMAVSGGKAAASAAKTTGAIVKTGASMVATGAKTVATGAIMAGGLVKSMALGTAAIAKNGAAWVANKGRVVASTTALVVSKVPIIASAVATGIATAATWAWNAALVVATSPITLIVLGIVALIAIIVLLVKNWGAVVSFMKSTWSGFMSWLQPGLAAIGSWWSGLWNGAKALVMSVWNGIVSWTTAKVQSFRAGLASIGAGISSWWSEMWNNISAVGRRIVGAVVNSIVGSFNRIVGTAKSVYSGVTGAFGTMVSWLGGLPGRVGSAVSGMWGGITSGFKGALNGVISAWNGFSLSVPGVEVFGKKIGGFTLNTPNLPYFEKGTNYFAGGPAIVGENGPEVVNLPAGSSVTPNGPTERALGNGSVTHVTNNNITINEAEDPLGSAGRIDRVLRKLAKK